MTIYFTADTHFKHKKILQYCNRPFATIDDHDEMLVHNWNAIVKPKDKVYIIGDFMFSRNREEIKAVTQRLNGSKFLILGNHDHQDICQDLFEWVKNYYVLIAHNIRWVLFHYPILEWDGWWRTKGSIHLYGHIHNRSENKDTPPHIQFLNTQNGCFNVGVDVNNFAPVSALTLARRFKKP